MSGTLGGYVHCTCGTCFEIAISDGEDCEALCTECEEAGCEPGKECQRTDLDEDDAD